MYSRLFWSLKLDLRAFSGAASDEQLEAELDTTVMQSGALASSLSIGELPPKSGGAAASDTAGTAVQPYLRVPSSAQRRLTQCLGLAKDLLTEKRRAEVAETKLLEAKGEAERLTNVADELQRKLRQRRRPLQRQKLSRRRPQKKRKQRQKHRLQQRHKQLQRKLKQRPRLQPRRRPLQRQKLPRRRPQKKR